MKDDKPIKDTFGALNFELNVLDKVTRTFEIRAKTVDKKLDGDHEVYIKGTHPMKLLGPPLPLNKSLGWNPTVKLSKCSGDCNTDDDCLGDGTVTLKCYSTDRVEPTFSCRYFTTEGAGSKIDYFSGNDIRTVLNISKDFGCA